MSPYPKHGSLVGLFGASFWKRTTSLVETVCVPMKCSLGRETAAAILAFPAHREDVSGMRCTVWRCRRIRVTLCSQNLPLRCDGLCNKHFGCNVTQQGAFLSRFYWVENVSLQIGQTNRRTDLFSYTTTLFASSFTSETPELKGYAACSFISIRGLIGEPLPDSTSPEQDCIYLSLHFLHLFLLALHDRAASVYNMCSGACVWEEEDYEL